MIEKLLLAALNHLLRQGAWARRQLTPFAGRRARFVMPPWQVGFTIGGDGLFAAAHGDEPDDVTVTLPADGPLQALHGLDRLMATAHVTGNAEFATTLSFVLKNLRWDAEEDLSRLVGDIAAHRLVRGATSLAAWQRQAGERLAENAAAYLGDEARLLTPVREFRQFRDDLTEFDHRLARLEARLASLN